MKKFLLALAILLFLLSLTCMADGISFNADDKYTVSGKLSLPQTVEAVITLPEEFLGRAGAVIGNYTDSATPSLNIEIHENGCPRFYFIDEDKNIYDATFTDVDVRTGEEVHLAITVNPEKRTVILFVNGEQAQRIKLKSLADSFEFDKEFIIGGDRRGGNTQFFKGEISSIALYSDVRTNEEIKNDFESGEIAPDELIAAWKMNESDIFTDISGKGHDAILTRSTSWLDGAGFKGDYAYSFAVVGDTQIVNRDYPDKLCRIYNWIIDNVDDKNIKFVFGLGDITDTDALSEWALAKELITKLDGHVPYSFVRGNHDGVFNYTNIFPYEEFKDTLDGSFDETMLNTYQTFEVGNIKYLVMCLDYIWSDKVLEWANEVVASHPDYNVIVTSHIYLYLDGTTVDGNDNTPAGKYGAENEADEVWEKFIRKHKNITLVLSGHIPSDKIVMSQVKGDNGNTVTQLLVDPQGIDATQGATGLVAMLYFSEDGKNVGVEYYSTVKEKFYLPDNSFSFTLDIVESQSKTSNSTLIWAVAGVVVIVAVVGTTTFVKKKKAK